MIRIATIAGLATMALAYFLVPGRTAPPYGTQVDEIFAQWNHPDSPGCAVAVIEAGGIVYKRGYGKADLEHNIPITPATVFHAASLAKQFTAMSIMLLVEQGRLSLDDDVHTYIDELRGLGASITIRDMLHHISGIKDQWELVTIAGWRMSDDVVTRSDVLDLVKRMTSLHFPPRERFLYSNTNYLLAGLIVERVSKRPLSEFARENIFQPLGMAHTTFTDNHDQIIANHAYGYRGTQPPFDLPPFLMRMPNYDLTGPTNLLTTVEDLARWERNFDDKTVGGETALKEMQTPARLSNGTTFPYGFGLELTSYRGLKTVEHDGRDAGYRSHLLRFPDQHFAVACLCNLALRDSNLPGKLARSIADVYLADLLGPTPAQPPPVVAAPRQPAPADLSKYTGRYYSEEIDATYVIKMQNSSLVLTRPKFPAADLEPHADDTFKTDHFSEVYPLATLRFTRDAQGSVSGFFLDLDRAKNVQFTRSS